MVVQVLAQDDPIDAMALLPRPAGVLTLSGGGRHLRAWHAGDGSLLWHSYLGMPRTGALDGASECVEPAAQNVDDEAEEDLMR